MIDALLAEFRVVLTVHPVYFFISVFLGIFRIITLDERLTGNRYQFKKNNNMWHMSDSAGFRYTMLSHAHKVVAAIYYYQNIRAAVRLGDSIYYAKDAWCVFFCGWKKGKGTHHIPLFLESDSSKRKAPRLSLESLFTHSVFNSTQHAYAPSFVRSLIVLRRVTLFHRTGGSQRELRNVLRKRHHTDDIVPSGDTYYAT